MKIFKQCNHYGRLMRLHRPIGSLLLLWPSLSAIWLASHGQPSVKIVMIFIAGTFVMRSAGCVINDLTDRNFDGRVKRTADRPLVTQVVSTREASILFTLLIVCAFLLVLQLNNYAIQLAFVGLVLAIIYPFSKRFIQVPQLVLGFAFAWGVPMAYAAIVNSIPIAAWGLFIAAILWIIAYDTMYAMVDRDDDLRIGIKSTAILFANYDRLIIVLLQGLQLWIFYLLGHIYRLNHYYFGFLLLAAMTFVYQAYLLKDRDRERCLRAFLNNNWTGLLIFLGIYLG